ncbi:MAG: type II toxin-antitoxin system VapC family toxin [Terracidiphilus sp.]
MKALLDTCAMIWATLSPSSLSPKVRDLIADQANEVLVSAASAWEISTKVRLGRLPGAERLERDYLDVMDAAGYSQLAIDTESALRAGRLVADHRDPFDRMIAAQAMALDIPVLSPDAEFDLFGVRRVW